MAVHVPSSKLNGMKHYILSAGMRWLIILIVMVSGTTEAIKVGHTTINWITNQDMLKSGSPVKVGVQFNMDPNWHIYWKNPGESGLPPSFKWNRTPDREYHWPAPKKVTIGGVKNFVYYDELMAVFEWSELNRPLAVTIDWLECETVCIPQTVSLNISWPISDASQLASDRIQEAILKGSLQEIMGHRISTEKGDQLSFPIQSSSVQSVYFFPLSQDIFEYPDEYSIVTSNQNTLINLPFSEAESRSFTSGVLTVKNHDESIRSYRVSLPSVPSFSLGQFLQMCGFAFIGGMILNLMPCVFPILAFKIYHIIHQHPSRIERLRNNLAYLSGVMMTFGLLALSIWAVQQIGIQLGWGFQLQSPVFVGVMTVVMMIVTLNLLDLNQVPSGLLSLMSKPSGGSFQSKRTSNVGIGMLSVVMATPCTAPFMAPAIGFALTQNIGVILGVFSCLGLGFALPVITLSMSDQLVSRLPKPGPWMVVLKKWLAIPMFFTALGLMWVFYVQTSFKSLVILLSGVVMIAGMGLWIKYQSNSRKTGSALQRLESYGWGMILLVVTVTLFFGIPSTIERAASTIPVSKISADLAPLFVDVTAEWCVTCKVNEATVLNTKEIQALFKTYGVQYTVLDWTTRDDTITQYLSSFNRSGVPLYVFYPNKKEPIILPQILTKAMIRRLLESEIILASQTDS